MDNGRLEYAGSGEGFIVSDISVGLTATEEDASAPTITPVEEEMGSTQLTTPEGVESSAQSTIVDGSEETDAKPPQRKAARKLVEDERRVVGHIGRDIWLAYIRACGVSVPLCWLSCDYNADPILTNDF